MSEETSKQISYTRLLFKPFSILTEAETVHVPYIVWATRRTQYHVLYILWTVLVNRLHKLIQQT